MLYTHCPLHTLRCAPPPFATTGASSDVMRENEGRSSGAKLNAAWAMTYKVALQICGWEITEMNGFRLTGLVGLVGLWVFESSDFGDFGDGSPHHAQSWPH